jgi:hypothetical protein
MDAQDHHGNRGHIVTAVIGIDGELEERAFYPEIALDTVNTGLHQGFRQDLVKLYAGRLFVGGGRQLRPSR